MPVLDNERDLRIYNLRFLLRKLEKEERIKSKVSRRKEIRIRLEINETERRNQYRKKRGHKLVISEMKDKLLLQISGILKR